MILRYLRYKLIRIKRHQRRYVRSMPPYAHCKNCGHELHGQYCSVCGQHAFIANQPFKDSVLSYLDTNYAVDKQLGHTMRDLLLRPGYLAREYMNGRIARQVHPFKLYFFASILLFGILVPLTQDFDQEAKVLNNKPLVDTLQQKKSEQQHQTAALPPDSAARTSKNEILKGKQEVKADEREKESDVIIFENENDSSMSTLERHAKKNLTGVSRKELLQRFLRYLSFSVLFLMPVFALLLMLVYRSKERFYIGHLILSVHQHVVLYFAISLSLVWEMLISAKHTIGTLLFWATVIYFVLSLANFYREKIVKSVLKAFLLLFLYLIICSIAIFAVAMLVILI